ncbi:MAG TPA: SGNH/GDSL hydrolase family protein, partial [Flavitalea sp.]|nr:SGNH/GDSL hydrolase family protein [Flavitalea sp.]
MNRLPGNSVKTSGLYIIFFVVCIFPQTLIAQAISKDTKRILFLGNSITYSGGYVNDVEAYLLAHYPKKQYEVINVGLPSETVSGLSEPGHADGRFPRPDLHERLDRILRETKPDLVFACYGMNDGIYQPFDQKIFVRFKEGIEWMHEKIVNTGARLIHITPPVYDDKIDPAIKYEAVLQKYSDWLLELRASRKWEVIDIHYPMLNYLAAHQKIDAQYKLNGFALAPDGVHPGATGHWIMARQILSYLGFKEVMIVPGISEDLAKIHNGKQIFALVKRRQVIMRDAWLSLTKHQRPGLPDGLPMKQATDSSAKIAQELDELIRKDSIIE